MATKKENIGSISGLDGISGVETPVVGQATASTPNTLLGSYIPMVDMLRASATTSVLDASGTAYVTAILNRVTAEPMHTEPLSKIQMTPITHDGYDLRVFYRMRTSRNGGKYAEAVALAFDTPSVNFDIPSMMATTSTPSFPKSKMERGSLMALRIKEVIASYDQNGMMSADNVNVLNIVNVTPSMYNRDIMMANYIALSLNRYPAASGRSLLSRSREIEGSRDPMIVCYSDVDKVRQYLQQVSPHDVPARVDAGIVLTLETPPAANSQNTEGTASLLLVIGGYTTFNTTGNITSGSILGRRPDQPASSKCNTPIFCITDCYTPYANTNILPIGLSALAFVMGSSERWMMPYTMRNPMRQDLGLLPANTEDGKPIELKSDQAVEAFINYYVERTPLFALDIAIGRASIPGIDRWLNPVFIAEDLKSFFGDAADPRSTLLTNLYNEMIQSVGDIYVKLPTPSGKWTEYIGNANIPSKVAQSVDSRSIDYLYLASHNMDRAQLIPMLKIPTNPAERLIMLSDERLSITVKPDYVMVRNIFSNNFLSKLIGFVIESHIAGRITFKNIQQMPSAQYALSPSMTNIGALNFNAAGLANSGPTVATYDPLANVCWNI